LGIVLCIFAIHIRSNFLWVPFQTTAALIPVVVAYVLNQLRARVRGARVAGAAL
jgi:hypothetical protein